VVLLRVTIFFVNPVTFGLYHLMDCSFRRVLRAVHDDTAVSLDGDGIPYAASVIFELCMSVPWLSLRVENYVIVLLGYLHYTADDVSAVFHEPGKR